MSEGRKTWWSHRDADGDGVEAWLGNGGDVMIGCHGFTSELEHNVTMGPETARDLADWLLAWAAPLDTGATVPRRPAGEVSEGVIAEIAAELRLPCGLSSLDEERTAAADMIERLTKERDEARAERDRVAAEWADVSQRNFQRAKAAEAEIERLREALEPFGREHVQPWHETPDDAAMVPVLDDEHRDGRKLDRDRHDAVRQVLRHRGRRGVDGTSAGPRGRPGMMVLDALRILVSASRVDPQMFEETLDACEDYLTGSEDEERTVERMIDGIRWASRISAAVDRGGSTVVRIMTPDGASLTHEWGPEGVSGDGRETVMASVALAMDPRDDR